MAKSPSTPPSPQPNIAESMLINLVDALQPLANFAQKISAAPLPDSVEIENFPILTAGDWRRLYSALVQATESVQTKQGDKQ